MNRIKNLIQPGDLIEISPHLGNTREPNKRHICIVLESNIYISSSGKSLLAKSKHFELKIKWIQKSSYYWITHPDTMREKVTDIKNYIKNNYWIIRKANRNKII